MKNSNNISQYGITIENDSIQKTVNLILHLINFV